MSVVGKKPDYIANTGGKPNRSRSADKGYLKFGLGGNFAEALARILVSDKTVMPEAPDSGIWPMAAPKPSAFKAVNRLPEITNLRFR